MIKRIDIFMPPRSQYGVLHHFSKKFHEALNHIGVNCRLLEAERTNPKPFLDKLFQDRPDCTLSFNGLLPDEEGRFFCDMINIPHVACLVDSANQFFPLAESPLTIITSPDRFSCEFFKGLNCKNVLFMPHGVEKELAPNKSDKKKYDVVMLSSCIDYEALRESWTVKYSKALCNVLDEAAEITLSDQVTPYVDAFVRALNTSIKKPGGVKDPNKINFFEVLDDLEIYIRGKDRIELLRAIKDAKVHIFGSNAKSATWKKYLGQSSNIHIHDPVPFEQALEIMKETKILLNSCPWIKNGGHERIFSGLACGALVITNENIYMNEYFKDDSSIGFYQHGKWSNVNGKINTYLADESKRKKIADQGRQIVLNFHTWDHRASTLVKELEPILSSLAC